MLTLKKVQYFASMSEETNCFTADLYFNGKRVATAHNRGHGGPTDVRFDNESDERAVSAYVATLPEREYRGIKLENTVDFVVDMLVDDYVDAKNKKKADNALRKAIENGICYEEGGVQYSVRWKGLTIAAMLQNPKHARILRSTVERMRSEGKTVLNTNIPF